MTHVGSRRLALLGPQRRRPRVAATLERLGARGRVAVVNAGWREREPEDGELLAEAGENAVNLELYARAQRIFLADPEFAAAHRARQESLRQLRRVYDSRLAHAMEAWREMAVIAVDPVLRQSADEAAAESVRFLDRWHLGLVDEILAEFDDRLRPAERRAVATEHDQLRSLLADATALAIAGGHIAVLSNRLRLLGVAALLDERPGLPVVAWSAGAMAIGELVVLFHDSPPQGPGNAEAFGRGLGLYAGTLVFPHGSRRLRIDDPGRVGRLARRFAPLECVLLDEETRLERAGEEWDVPESALRLAPDGSVERLASS